MSFTIVTFCTPEYADCIPHWQEKCKELNIGYLNMEVQSCGDWKKNTRLKPKALFHARNTLKGTLLYFDIDGKLLLRPAEPLSTKWDFGIIRNPRVEHKTKISSQCLWLADTLAVRRVLAWWDYITICSTGNDHPALARALRFAEQAGEARVVYVEDTVKNSWLFNGQRPQRSQATLQMA